MSFLQLTTTLLASGPHTCMISNYQLTHQAPVFPVSFFAEFPTEEIIKKIMTSNINVIDVITKMDAELKENPVKIEEIITALCTAVKLKVPASQIKRTANLVELVYTLNPAAKISKIPFNELFGLIQNNTYYESSKQDLIKMFLLTNGDNESKSYTSEKHRDYNNQMISIFMRGIDCKKMQDMFDNCIVYRELITLETFKKELEFYEMYKTDGYPFEKFVYNCATHLDKAICQADLNLIDIIKRWADQHPHLSDQMTKLIISSFKKTPSAEKESIYFMRYFHKLEGVQKFNPGFDYSSVFDPLLSILKSYLINGLPEDNLNAVRIVKFLNNAYPHLKTPYSKPFTDSFEKANKYLDNLKKYTAAEDFIPFATKFAGVS